MRRPLAALALALLLPLPLPGHAAEQYVVKPGETLSEIAERHGVSTSRLMQLNGIKNADLVESGSRLRLPGSQPSAETLTGRGNYTVKPGETLSEIADSRGISLKRLMDLNGIQQADRIEAGSRLIVPGGSGGAAPATPARPAALNRNARDHVVQPGETLSGIADRYGIPMSRLVSINAITTPSHVEAGTRLALRTSAATKPAAAKPVAAKPAAAKPVAKPAPQAATTTAPRPAARPANQTAARPAQGGAPDWRTYGPLQIDFANWQPLGGSQVAPALNGGGQEIFLAVNCTARKLNTTGETGTWKSWDQPQSDFEERLIVDACQAKAQTT
ncbi:LysM peptidoglycan-binding domain-containing protein [Synechococcus sp. CS-1325]|uniref:LysM peptidoglycan-binding domain-containing protein n=1 Tax=Synechococcus sp. CS-1325 TaxID=2847979 RepID=UPI000DB2C584|nr:LysM peptidoglycan-binding domain-containing protein [Synechococcus sp. CS-1325]MCT0198954.1 LysM peptidoglycan-binding domain-containing protein [Synechococcus sp. CS-1325]PZU99085.1 MAG: peptidoglycan-binding protein [Cyanobium sp.]